MVVYLLSHVWLLATLWTVACQAPLSWDFTSKNTGLGYHFLLQGNFLTQGSNPGLLYCRHSAALQVDSLPTEPPFLVDCHLLKATLFDLSTKYDVCCVLCHVLLLVTPWIVACQAPLSMGFSWKKYWRGLPFPPLGDLLDPGIELESPTLQADSLPSNHLGIPKLL